MNNNKIIKLSSVIIGFILGSISMMGINGCFFEIIESILVPIAGFFAGIILMAVPAFAEMNEIS